MRPLGRAIHNIRSRHRINRCFRAAHTCDVNKLAVVWQLFATGFATDCEIKRQRNRKDLQKAARFLLRTFPEIGSGAYLLTPAARGGGKSRGRPHSGVPVRKYLVCLGVLSYPKNASFSICLVNDILLWVGLGMGL